MELSGVVESNHAAAPWLDGFCRFANVCVASEWKRVASLGTLATFFSGGVDGSYIDREPGETIKRETRRALGRFQLPLRSLGLEPCLLSPTVDEANYQQLDI